MEMKSSRDASLPFSPVGIMLLKDSAVAIGDLFMGDDMVQRRKVVLEYWR